MTGPEVTYVPEARAKRVVVVKHGNLAMHLTLIEAQALDVRLERVLAAVTTQGQPGGGISSKQNRHLHALLREQGAVGPERHMVLSRILQREISSVNDLSFVEASRCIDILRDQREVPNEPDGAVF